jgi:hypothetical protein
MGAAAVGLVLIAWVAQLVVVSPWDGAETLLATGLAAGVALAGGALCVRSVSPAARIDGALWAYLIAELGLIALLFRMSAGAWLNYGIPATVFASVLAARPLARAVAAARSPLAALSAALAALAMLATSLYGLQETDRTDRAEHAIARGLYKHLKRPRSSYFFTDRPGFNRVNGRLDLVHDHWLYPVFESLGLAEPRSRWLGQALTSGPVRAVVSTTDRSGSKGRTSTCAASATGPTSTWGPSSSGPADARGSGRHGAPSDGKPERSGARVGRRPRGDPARRTGSAGRP